MAITWSANFSGTPDDLDITAADLKIDEANAAITAENEQRAAQDPPLDPLPLFANANNTEKAASYKTIMGNLMDSTHANYKQQAADKQIETANWKKRFRLADPELRATIISMLPPLP